MAGADLLGTAYTESVILGRLFPFPKSISAVAHMLPWGFCRPVFLLALFEVAGGSSWLNAMGSSNVFHICVAWGSVIIAAGRQNNKRASIFALCHWKIASPVSSLKLLRAQSLCYAKSMLYLILVLLFLTPLLNQEQRKTPMLMVEFRFGVTQNLLFGVEITCLCVSVFLELDVTQPCSFEKPPIPQTEVGLCKWAAVPQGNGKVLCFWIS